MRRLLRNCRARVVMRQVARAEHILLESDEHVVPAVETARKLHARLELTAATGRRSTELALIDRHFLSVRITQAKLIKSRYVVDLRFVDPAPRLERRIPWRWVAAFLTFGVLATIAAREVAASAAPWWRHEWLPAAVAFFLAAACALFAAIWLTTETLTLFSAHGRAKLVAHTGRAGTLRACRGFLPRLDTHLRIAFAARRNSRTEHLRDEMREHFRLKNAGVLSDDDYEAAKRRILATHVPPAASAPEKKARESPPGPLSVRKA